MGTSPRAVRKIDLAAMTAGDIPEVYLIEQAAFPSPWSLKTFYQALAEDVRFKAFVARGREDEDRGRILGYAAFFDLEEEYHLISMAVRPDRRRMRVGQQLLDHILRLSEKNSISRVTLEVRASNEAAISFYSSRRFVPVAIRKNYYEDNGEDAVVMWINLTIP